MTTCSSTGSIVNTQLVTVTDRADRTLGNT